MELSHSIVIRYNRDKNKVEDTKTILNKHINDYKKKFVTFKFSCKILSNINRDYPKHILIKKNKFKPSAKINMQITFNSKLDNVTYKHYLQQPRQAIETNLIKKFINQNSDLLKICNSFPQPVFR